MNALEIERMNPDGWKRVRRVRLRAFADTPNAFGTTFAEAEARPPRDWRTHIADDNVAIFVGKIGLLDVGIAIGAPYRGFEGSAGLFGMWVAPEFRGQGVAGRLIDAVVLWARERGHTRVLLDVGDSNAPAIRLYESKGFVPTGRTGSLPPPREDVPEHQRELTLQALG